ncbi:MAG: hypothetical protein WAW06_05315 [bacterium]
MNNRRSWLLIVTALAVVAAFAASAQGGTRLGVGAHYWKALEDIELDEVDESGVSWLASVQLGSSALVKAQIDVEMFPKGFVGSSDIFYAPQAFVIVGRGVYGGLGIGVYYDGEEFADDPFYLLRAGLDVELTPKVYLDLNANYRFEQWKNLGDVVEDIDTDVITLGAAVRLEL